VLFADLLAQQAKAAPLAAQLVDATVESASHFAAGTACTAASALAPGLAEGVLQTMKAQPAIARPKSARQPVRSAKPLQGAHAAARTGSLFGRGFFLWSAVGLAGLLATTVALFLLWSPSRRDQETEALLARLRAVQRDWWDNEGLAGKGG